MENPLYEYFHKVQKQMFIKLGTLLGAFIDEQKIPKEKVDSLILHVSVAPTALEENILQQGHYQVKKTKAKIVRYRVYQLVENEGLRIGWQYAIGEEKFENYDTRTSNDAGGSNSEPNMDKNIAE